MSHTVLLIEKDEKLRSFWQEALKGEGFRIQAVAGRQAALESARANLPDLVFLGTDFDGRPGIALLKELRDFNEDIVVMTPTNQRSVREELEAAGTRSGTSTHPAIQIDQVKIAIKDALRMQDSKRRETYLLDRERSLYQFENVVAESPKMQVVLKSVSQVIQSDATVLLLGETGTGKEVIAKAVHYNGLRSRQPFLAVNCTALPENLLESELFGHEAGAFTDARKLKKGLFEVADGGTLFLDEIGDLALLLQAKLLRVVEEKTFSRVGGAERITVDTRIIAATNRDLERAVSEGKFREDLYFRLKVFPIYVPPLREHKEDIIALAKHFVRQLNEELDREIKGLSFSAEQKLTQYNWPGNIRELRNVIERAILLCTGDLIESDDLLLERTPHFLDAKEQESAGLKEMERQWLIRALEKTRWNQTQAARLLKISRFALLNRIKKFNINRKA
ncbi:MAG: hypothetical protein A3G87_00035 [Omnitrophica bacterium RIFCSPLOWO2_12_FULL_50_11]|nr:MAG: hypothetical protein A3G87_00035 [Omnitrophica bacterium RIFCSPLOWO2_12_FULL_50_11]